MIRQFKQSVDDLMRTDELLLKGNFVPTFLDKDDDIFSVSWARTFDKRIDGVTYSLYLSYLNELKDILVEANYASLRLQYPRGIPGHLVDFLLEDAIDWLQENLGRLPQPFEETTWALAMTWGNWATMAFILAQAPPWSALTSSPASKGTSSALRFRSFIRLS